MTPAARTVRAFLALQVLALPIARVGQAQFGVRESLGQLYRIAVPPTARRTFTEVQVDRIAPHGLAMPAPITPLRLDAPLQALTGLVHEVPERQLIYFSGIDAGGAARLFEIDLVARQVRQILPPPGGAAPYAVEFLVTPQASKLYVRWYRSATAAETDIYDGATLDWLGRTFEFAPDARALGFQQVEPYLWTLDRSGRPILVDSNADRVVRSFDLQRWLGPVRGVTEDAWRDLLLVRTDVGHDRFQVIDITSGEIGPPLELEGYAQAEARLALAGRLLVLVEFERRAQMRGRPYPVPIASGAGSIYDLSAGDRSVDFRLAVPFDLPVAALGATADPTAPGRLWVHSPRDEQRLDFDIPACSRQAPPGDRVNAKLEVRRDSAGDPPAYFYRLSVDPQSPSAAAALAIEAARAADRTGKPDGWGVDLIARDRWVRWTNAIGPASENVPPGSARDGFVIRAREATLAGIADYRIQGVTRLPRGCESDDHFLENSVAGHTVAPERVETRKTGELVQRLLDLLQRACEIGWAAPAVCEDLRESALTIQREAPNPAAAVDRFLRALGESDVEPVALLVLGDAARAVMEMTASDGP
jgi:hypothetical protein